MNYTEFSPKKKIATRYGTLKVNGKYYQSLKKLTPEEISELEVKESNKKKLIKFYGDFYS